MNDTTDPIKLALAIIVGFGAGWAWTSLTSEPHSELIDRGIIAYCDVTGDLEFHGECPA